MENNQLKCPGCGAGVFYGRCPNCGKSLDESPNPSRAGEQRDNLRMALAELMADVRNAPKEFQRAVNHDMLRACEAIAMCSPPAEPVKDSPVENDRLNKAKDLSLDWFKEKSRADDLTDKLQQAHADIRYWKEQYERLRFPQ